jgi:hypothetical protein
VFSDLSKYSGHLRLRHIDPQAIKRGAPTAGRTCACVADLLRRFEIDDELEIDWLVWFDVVENLST